ncbi:MAG TPA: metal-sensitive transcriptional regulator [Microbacteriaceae bacterium]|nr:metal-sensitive transcriptional regulator [Microbacteriaceae bacterium]HQX35218.1 metal-sensitive transcriptional regulator [Microbacteriaceae bacterium]HQZ47173.1 metal-sensitive transcriptional regulator [Microbacteriaceae bacterium]HRA08274.1 metal-sensitive transcriptional regulator [Microbacteriaceae bacterium]
MAAAPTPAAPVSSPSSDEARRKVLNRLRRAQGQLTAVIAAVEAEASCRQVITQLAAVSSALDRAGFAIISTAMQECITDPEGEASGDPTSPEELEKLFMMLA